jgi:pimeloyl-ACP methyl ester carboxylesterase
VREALKLSYFDPGLVTEDVVQAYAEPLRQSGGRYALSWSARQILPADVASWTARYPEISVPTLLLWGSHDRVVPLRVGERLQRTLPRARLEVLRNCGHMPPEEKPGESLERVQTFLRGEGVVP